MRLKIPESIFSISVLLCVVSIGLGLPPTAAAQTGAEPTPYKQFAQLGRGIIAGASWEPNDKVFVVNSNQGAWVYNRDFEDLAHFANARLAMFSPSGKIMAATQNIPNEVNIWDAQNYKLMATIAGQDKVNLTTALSISPDDRQIAIGSNENVSVFEIASGRRVFLLPVVSPVMSLTWKADGQLLAVGVPKQVKLIDTSNWQIRATLDDVGIMPISRWSPDGQQLVTLAVYLNIRGETINSLKVWDAKTFQLRIVIQAPYAQTFAWSPDGEYLVAGDENLYMWNAQTGEVVSSGLTDVAFHQPMLAIEWNAEGSELLIADANNTVRFYAWPPKSNENRILSGFSGEVTALDWSSDGTKLVDGSTDGSVRLWDAVSQQPIATFEQSSNSITSVDWRPDGSEIAVGASFDDQVHIWDITSQQEVMTLYGHGESVNRLDGQGILSVDWKPNSSILASGGWDAKARVWDATQTQGEALHEFDGKDLGGVKVAWSSTGDLLVGLAHPYFTQRVQIWNPLTGKLVQTIDCNVCESLGSFAWSPDASMMALGGEYGESGGAVMLWETASAKFIRALVINGSTVKDVDWSKTGQIAAMGYNHIYIWDNAEADTPIVFDVTDPTVIKWSPDGKRLAVGSKDGTITIWEER